ncbi:MAG: hypothetical protein JXK05_13310 [Campylobacterales bacterium]|nr:hypothetical protein [Campylobacterales bacterium]
MPKSQPLRNNLAMRHSIRTSIDTTSFYRLEAESAHSSKAAIIEEALRFYFKFRPLLHDMPTVEELERWSATHAKES